MKYSQLLLLLACCCLFSCDVVQVEGIGDGDQEEGVAPIYASADGWDQIYASEPQPIQYLGKIYYKDQLIFVNERNKGIHILDNSNPMAPLPIHFIHILGNEDIAIKGNILYADNISDLVAIDISDLANIEVTSRVKDLYDRGKKDYPDGYNGYFECVDPAKGIVIGWEEKILDNPACRR